MDINFAVFLGLSEKHFHYLKRSCAYIEMQMGLMWDMICNCSRKEFSEISLRKRWIYTGNQVEQPKRKTFTNVFNTLKETVRALYPNTPRKGIIPTCRGKIPALKSFQSEQYLQFK